MRSEAVFFRLNLEQKHGNAVVVALLLSYHAVYLKRPYRPELVHCRGRPVYLNIVLCGATENAGLENGGLLKMQGWKMQDWKTWDQIAGVENVELENAGPYRKGGNRRTGKRRTSFAGVENAGQSSMEREMFTCA